MNRQTTIKLTTIYVIHLAVCFVLLGVTRIVSSIFSEILAAILISAVGTGVVYSFFDRHKEGTIEQYDPLTGLPGKHLFYQHLQQELSDTASKDSKCAIFYLNIDRFKNVNDSLGRKVANMLLQAVAKRLTSLESIGETVSRHGGDEFVFFLKNTNDSKYGSSIAQTILDLLSLPFLIEGHELYITASIGISRFPFDGETAEQLLQYAETAMYQVKTQGKNNYQFYSASLSENVAERMELENSLRNALKKEEFFLSYQPKVDIKTNQVIGMEALLRWNHGKLGMISPAKFIPIAEESGLIVPIGEWVLRMACKQNKDWQDAGFPPLRVAVNLSARQFQKKNLVEVISKILAETGLEPRWLEVEVTESILMQNMEFTVSILQQLQAIGIHISIDDFGTGYSSLNYLKRFPINSLKIDQSFVQDIATDPDDAAIVTAVISLAHHMKLKVIAEGVETEGQLEFLRMRNCDDMQGYYFSKPLKAEEFTKLLESSKEIIA
ncbi:bifunctional diguanylate cyclase/phosphodiesterase [Fodinisporobacter ferrooxydans]|uniref:Bifunctional diguanylate cyclase/phosphodiesterase n=1 Tax=Fodinisporobacter ferrooxydans TaxID=2901836 RepID=A0ABY4CI35_9BACL|nr:bifunctional diguanylate cyclase/phosphodiesterase [Alicyclobacillaceae bacterium MYW30-H2]